MSTQTFQGGYELLKLNSEYGLSYPIFLYEFKFVPVVQIH